VPRESLVTMSGPSIRLPPAGADQARRGASLGPQVGHHALEAAWEPPVRGPRLSSSMRAPAGTCQPSSSFSTPVSGADIDLGPLGPRSGQGARGPRRVAANLLRYFGPGTTAVPNPIGGTSYCSASRAKAVGRGPAHYRKPPCKADPRGGRPHQHRPFGFQATVHQPIVAVAPDVVKGIAGS
jgi:hypothetical protein